MKMIARTTLIVASIVAYYRSKCSRQTLDFWSKGRNEYF